MGAACSAIPTSNSALNELVVVAEDRGRRKITNREAIITQLVNRSATADWRAVRIMFDILRDIEGQSDPASSEISAFTAADEMLIADGCHAVAAYQPTCDMIMRLHAQTTLIAAPHIQLESGSRSSALAFKNPALSCSMTFVRPSSPSK